MKQFEEFACDQSNDNWERLTARIDVLFISIGILMQGQLDKDLKGIKDGC